MSLKIPGYKNRIPISECEICSRLAEVETSFYKYGWDDMDRPLPPEASRLEIVADSEAEEPDKRHVRRCPICGTFYHYSMSYDYYVNGSEDEENLTRLTPDQAARYLTDDEYVSLIGAMIARLEHPDALTRRYAAKCLVSHHLERSEYALLEKYLIHPDPEVAQGALAFLAMLAGFNYKLAEMSNLNKVLHEIRSSTDQDRADKASYLLDQIATYEKHHGSQQDKAG